jgi:transcription elongation GreA/GreB family factor
LNKQLIVEKIIAALTEELESSMRSARAARAEAAHEQNKAENKYDTRSLEASYLANGQSRQAAEVIQSIQLYRGLALRDFAPGEPIELGALVELEQKGETRTFWLIGPRAGGTEVECEGETVLVITPQSPMGQQLVGRKQGDQLQIQAGPKADKYRVSRVS